MKNILRILKVTGICLLSSTFLFFSFRPDADAGRGIELLKPGVYAVYSGDELTLFEKGSVLWQKNFVSQINDIDCSRARIHILLSGSIRTLSSGGRDIRDRELTEQYSRLAVTSSHIYLYNEHTGVLTVKTADMGRTQMRITVNNLTSLASGPAGNAFYSADSMIVRITPVSIDTILRTEKNIASFCIVRNGIVYADSSGAVYADGFELISSITLPVTEFTVDSDSIVFFHKGLKKIRFR
ncbi:MAG: hypothetical protein R6U31_03935 [bacterium]